MQPPLSEMHANILHKFERMLDEEDDPAGRRLLERLIEDEKRFLREMPFRWGAVPTD